MLATNFKYQRNRIFSITKTGESILNGLIFSDAWLSFSGSKTALFYMDVKHNGFALFCAQKLSNEGLDISLPKFRHHKYGDSWYIRTPASITMCEYRNKWYFNNKKHLPIDISYDQVFWLFAYLGDGTLRFNGKYNQLRVEIGTYSYTREECEQLCRILSQVFIHVGLEKQKSGYKLIMCSANAYRFLAYIGECPYELKNIYGYKWRQCKDGRTKADWIFNNRIK